MLKEEEITSEAREKQVTYRPALARIASCVQFTSYVLRKPLSACFNACKRTGNGGRRAGRLLAWMGTARDHRHRCFFDLPSIPSAERRRWGHG